MSEHWYVVHTQVQGEDRADLNLRRQGFVTYLPRYLRARRHARRTETVARPLFPRYLSPWTSRATAGGRCNRLSA
jgi:transcriptional antiterminator RfaH